jgi:hypothetical protein
MKLSEVFPSMLCRSSIAQHGKSMLLQNHIEYFKKKSEFAQRLRSLLEIFNVVLQKH